MNYVSGRLYRDGAFSPGYIGFEDGFIAEIGEGELRGKVPLASGVIIPTFINCHTHIGDSVVTVEPRGTIEELVAPPNGLKHRILMGSSDADIANSIRKTSRRMVLEGISTFCDFREEGLRGISQMKMGLRGSPISSVVLGRPKSMRYDRKEVSEILGSADGLGVSSITDWDYSELEKLASHCRREKKLFALHGSERIREDVDDILDLKPSFLVHMTKATDSDLERCRDSRIPVVLCPRSNMFFCSIPNIPKMLRKGLLLALGTDNAMISSPSMFREMEFAYRLSRLHGEVPAREILKMALVNPRKALNARDDCGIQEGAKANFLVLDINPKREDLEYRIVAGGCREETSLISMGKFMWQRK